MQELRINPTIIERDPAVSAYFKSISKFPLLTPEEEADLAERIQQGDEDAYNKLVNSNLRFVVSVASQFHCKFLKILDLINEGNIGLMKAAREFDPTRGFRFTSYAVFWIRQAMQTAILQHDSQIRLPTNKVLKLNKIKAFRDDFFYAFERQPTLSEIADGLKMTEDELLKVLDANSTCFSLNGPIKSEDGDDEILGFFRAPDQESPDEKLEKESLSQHVRTSLASVLPDRQRLIVEQFYGIGTPQLSLDEIATRQNVCKERARQLLESSLRQIKRSRHFKSLKSYE